MTGMPRVNINLGEALWDYVKKPLIVSAAIASLVGVGYSAKLIVDQAGKAEQSQQSTMSLEKPGQLELNLGLGTLDADGDGKMDLRLKSTYQPQRFDRLLLNKGNGMYLMVPIEHKDGRDTYALPGEASRILPEASHKR